jgi:2-isopropylmalate synthase
MEVPPRWPYGGDLVFTAFSGSHQDAINKGFAVQKADEVWEVPYLPIDPQDMGRTYEAIIRINSQSGKGGVAYVMDHDFGLDLPKEMRVEFGKIINRIADKSGGELSNDEIREAFESEYLRRETPLKVLKFRAITTKDDSVECHAQVTWNGEEREIRAKGNGPINAFVVALGELGVPAFDIANFSQHSLEGGAGAHAVCYIQIRTGDKSTFYGAAIDTNIEFASIKAVASAVNRAFGE